MVLGTGVEFKMARTRYYFSDRLAKRRSRRIKFSCAFIAVLAVSIGMGLSHKSCAGEISMVSLSSPSSVTDSCLPLLKSIRHKPEIVADGNQRPAGA